MNATIRSKDNTMSFGLPPNINKGKTKNTFPSQLGGSSPVLVSHTTGMLPAATGPSTWRDTSNITIRSISTSHAASHAKTAKTSSPPGRQDTLSTRPTQTSPPRAATRQQLEVRTSFGGFEQGAQTEFSLNSPTGSNPALYPGYAGAQESFETTLPEGLEAAKEQEVLMMALPEKDKYQHTHAGQTGASSSYNLAQLRAPAPFSTNRQVKTSTIGSQYIPPFR